MQPQERKLPQRQEPEPERQLVLVQERVLRQAFGRKRSGKVQTGQQLERRVSL
jgi:hypothetical protein